MAFIEATDVISVGNQSMDDDHQAFIDLLNQLAIASNTAFAGLFLQLFEHCEQHFARENRLMQEHGFPAEGEHKGEHARVLGEFRQFKSQLDKGRLAFGRSFVKERLPQWFQLHAATMDSALAAHIQARLGK